MSFPYPKDAGRAVAERAAELLCVPEALLPLTLPQARVVVQHMQPRRMAAGTTFMRAGDASETDYLVLVIDGEVTVQNAAPGAAEGQVVTVLGPGSLIGTMGLIDGSPRSATCTAATDLAVGVLTRAAMLDLIRHKPEVGARLLLAIAKQLSDDVRDANRKLLTLSQLTRALQQELDATHAVNRRLLEGGSPPAPTAG
jgi:CRP-like cAMP-binding protein